MTSAVPINAPPPRGGASPNASSARIIPPQHPQHPQQHQSLSQQQLPRFPPPPAAPQSASPPSKMDLKSWWKGFQAKKNQTQDPQQLQGQGSEPPLDFPLPRAMSIFHEDVERPARASRFRRLLGRPPQAQQEQRSFLASARSSDNDHHTFDINENLNGNGHVNAAAPSSSGHMFAGLFGNGGGDASEQRQQQSHSHHNSHSHSPFKKRGDIVPNHQNQQAEHATDTPHRGIFGVPLHESISYANVAISLVDEKGDSYIYGYVPIVVAKCGVFLKEKATHVEGIFRLSGSEKRIKELKTLFDSPDRYGKGLVWDGYTVHDAANVFRRYLNDLPEPVVPLFLYERFREPLRGATKKIGGDGDAPQFVEDFDIDGAIRKYHKLINELPSLNRQLLLYILDLLAVFAAKSDENRMTSQNLAAVFSPGIISHPNHAMAPEEYRLNQSVLIFLIENQDHFIIGMAPPTETASETQQSTTETATISSEAPLAAQQVMTAPAPAPNNAATAIAPAVIAPVLQPTMPTTEKAATETSTSSPTPPKEGAPIIQAAPNPAQSEKSTVPDGHAVSTPVVAPTPEYPRPLDTTGMIPVITTPTQPTPPPGAVLDGSQLAMAAPDSEDQNGGSSSNSPNGLHRSKSVPKGGRNKLKKPRPISENPSAQSSQVSLPATSPTANPETKP